MTKCVAAFLDALPHEAGRELLKGLPEGLD